MSVNTTTSKQIFSSDGVTSAFPVTAFKIYSQTELVISVKKISTGVITTLALTTDYTISITTPTALPSFFTLTLVGSYAALASGYQIIAQSNLPQTQLISFHENEGTPAATYQEALDRAVRLIQQLQDVLNRVVLRDIAYTSALTLPDLVAGTTLTTDGASLLWQAIVTTATTFNGRLAWGADSAKAASPQVGDVFFANDTRKLYFCSSAGTWSNSWTFDVATANALILAQQTSGPATSSTQLGLYVKAVSAQPEIFYRLASSGTEVQLTSGGKILVTALSTVYKPVTGSARNLKVTRPSSVTATITADELVLDSSVRITTVSVTPSISTAGPAANGRDQAGAFSTGWLYLYVIRKSSDGTVAGLWSASATAPTLPTGYDEKVLVSASYNGAGTLVDFVQQQGKYRFKASQSAYAASPGAGAWVSVDTTNFIPSALSDLGKFNLAAATSNGAVMTNDSSVAVAVGTTAPNKVNLVAAAGYNPQVMFDMSIFTANTVYVAGSAAITLYVDGFEINKLSF